MINANSPQNVVTAVQRVYSELPELIGLDRWVGLDAAIRSRIERLRRSMNPNEQLLLSIELMEQFAPYPRALERLNSELAIQVAVQSSVIVELDRLAAILGIDSEKTEAFLAASHMTLNWTVDPENMPGIEDIKQRKITLAPGGMDGGKSMKFSNMHLDLGEMGEIAAGSMLAGYQMIDKPHPLIIAAGILLTIRALRKAMTVEISEQHASVFWGMTKIRRLDNTCLESEILQHTNSEREKYGLKSLTEQDLRYSLSKLEQLHSIESVQDEPKTWRITETYVIKE
jgi:hypothetical protein